jgi:hypothetical protein
MSKVRTEIPSRAQHNGSEIESMTEPCSSATAGTGAAGAGETGLAVRVMSGCVFVILTPPDFGPAGEAVEGVISVSG